MSRRKVVTLLSVLTLGVNAILPVSTVMASEVEAVFSEQVKEEKSRAYFLIEYDGTEQVLTLDEGVALHLLGWNDEDKSTVAAKLVVVTDETKNEKDIELAADKELIQLEVADSNFVNIAVISGSLYSVKSIENSETTEAFIPLEQNENGSSKEQMAVVDQEGTIHEWKETVQFLDNNKEIISELQYLELNKTVFGEPSNITEADGINERDSEEVVEESELQKESVVSQPTFRTFSMIQTVDPSPSIVYSAHVQSYGWMPEAKDGQGSGIAGDSKRIEALKINITDLKDLGVEYATYVESIGWTNFVADGQMSGTEKQSKRIEALKIRLRGAQAANYDVYYRVHTETFGWLDWAKNGESTGTEGLSKLIDSIEIKLVKKGAAAPGNTTNTYIQKPKIAYNSYVRGIGWQNPVTDSQLSGTSGQRKALEAINIGFDSRSGLGIRYQTHLQSYGWLDWVENKTISGLPGNGKRLEAIRMELTGVNAKHYDVYYRVHVQNIGWLGWAKNGESAGSAGYGYQAEAYEVKVVPIGTAINRDGVAFREKDNTSIIYTSHVQSRGWLAPSKDGQASGTQGQALRLEALTISLNHDNYTGGIDYRAHVQSYGWMNPVQAGEIAGTTGISKRIEAIEINLTGEIANYYDVYYRTHIQSFGWLGWAKNGMPSGSEGMSKRIESIEIKLIEKGLPAPVVKESDAFKTIDKDIVFLDIGHGGSDPGAQYYGVKEKDLNLQIGQKLQRDLEAAGYSVIMSRTDDTYMDYSTERSRVANSSGADIFISLHNNAMPGNAYVNGIETFYYEYDPDYQPKINQAMHNDPERIIRSAVLANAIQESLITETGAYNRGVQRNTFAVLRETALPAVLVEFGFMSNLAELNKLQTQEYQSKLSDAVMNGVNSYFKTY